MGGLVLQVSPLVALFGSFGLSFTFVASLYLWKLAGFKDANRDETGTIQRRFISALLTCACSALLVSSLAQPVGPGDPGFTTLELLGLQSEQLGSACISCLSLTAALFIGPLVQHWANVWEGDAVVMCLPGGPWVALRNYVLAPFTEEFVFRACLVRLWIGASFPKALIILVSPFCFAMAHTHHFIELVRRHGNKRNALMSVAFQVFYTWLFGMFSNFLLLRTGSTTAVILTHSFCNHQGFPDLSFLNASEYHPLHQHRTWLAALYLIGITLFCWLIVPLTDGFDSSFVSPQIRRER